MIKIAHEGYPFIIGSAILTIIIYFITKNWITAIPFLLLLFMLFFFRDPDRTIPDIEGSVVSPADGKIVYINDINEKEFLKTNVKKISIFMSPLDVHINRAPYEGTVLSVMHTPGGFSAAYKYDASLKNENIAMVLGTKKGDILLRQVAGFLARRAVCRVKPDDFLKRGERFGIIKFSSRVDIYLPINIVIKVKLGDRVKAGESVIAFFSSLY